MEDGEKRRVSFGKRAGSDQARACTIRCEDPLIPRWSTRWSGTATGRRLESEAGRWLAGGCPQACGFSLQVVNILQHRQRGQLAQSEQDELRRFGVREVQLLADLKQLLVAEHGSGIVPIPDDPRHARPPGDAQLQAKAVGSQRPRSAEFYEQLAEGAQVCRTRAHQGESIGLLSGVCFPSNWGNTAP